MKNKNIIIRCMTMDDYDEVYALWMQCSGMGLNDLDDSRDGIQRFLSRNPDTCFVAIKDAKAIGCILSGNDGRRGYIYHTAVHPGFRHQGIGKQLVQSVMESFDALNIHKAALVVFERNQNGNAFWEKLGFTVRTDIIYRNKALVEMVRTDT